MDIFRLSERAMAMDDTTWRRHANPWSVYSRFSCLPLIVLAIWSRAWLGWGCLVPLALALLWTWLNPRLFPQPDRLDSWAARAVMGERIFLGRGGAPIPRHHERMALNLTWASGAGALILIFGLAIADPGLTIAGLVGSMLPKIWFCDRMVWLYHDTPADRRPG
ncbi:MAG: DUF6653 family protein [Pseudomonadota bacterium]